MQNDHSSSSPMESLSARATHALAVAMRRFGSLPFQEEQLLRVGQPAYSGAEYRVALLELRKAELLIAVRRGWGEKLYCVPPEVYFRWHPVLFPKMPEPVEQADIMYMDEHTPCPPLGLQLLHAAAELVKTGMKLTTKGILTKRTIEKCSQHLFLGNEAAAFLSFPPEMDGYPFKVAVMLDMAARLNIFVKHEKKLALHEEAFAGWMELPVREREAGLIRMWRDLYAVRTSYSADAAALVSRLEPFKWYRLDDLDHVLETRMHGVPDGSRQETPVRAWCRLMMQLGWMEEAATHHGERACRWLYGSTAMEQAEAGHTISEPIRVTPDCEVFVPPLASTAVRWQLEMMAERVQSDVMTIYRLNAKSIAAACERGSQYEELAAFLEYASGEPLPDTVQFAMEGWAQAGPAAAALPESISSGAESGHQLALDPLFTDPTKTDHLDRLMELPTVESLFQGLDEVPLVWRSQMRAYHKSTRRELMERALNWRVPVNLSVMGTIIPFVPDELVDGMGDWAVSGRLLKNCGAEPVKLKPDMWDEMMLVIPKLH
ncbi:helicase-associated domain-containing protein [Paenibacillus mendelii]|uniref:Helicase-associated domain-containing protein n=1 Tax=Paenibacillus mendelii TaxID=206163 RepID=A0ABV6J572_9BACL|nr:helicase-associated domain-containing protein [Paenibacillus mendelii]MCQ6560368.1 helicase-associated domain-containing protein [Paenibacillus mendelii]